METNREPDIYVMMVLTFDDKPAPTMAQIPLRKATDQAKSYYPEAAQVLWTKFAIQFASSSRPSEWQLSWMKY